MTISIQICVWLFYWGPLYSSTIKQSTTLTLKAFNESDINIASYEKKVVTLLYYRGIEGVVTDRLASNLDLLLKKLTMTTGWDLIF